MSGEVKLRMQIVKRGTLQDLLNGVRKMNYVMMMYIREAKLEGYPEGGT